MSDENQVDLDELEEALELMLDAESILGGSGTDPGAIGGTAGATTLRAAIGPLVDGGQTAGEIDAYYSPRATAVATSIRQSTVLGVGQAVAALKATIAAYEANEATQSEAAARVGSGTSSSGTSVVNAATSTEAGKLGESAHQYRRDLPVRRVVALVRRRWAGAGCPLTTERRRWVRSATLPSVLVISTTPRAKIPTTRRPGIPTTRRFMTRRPGTRTSPLRLGAAPMAPVARACPRVRRWPGSVVDRSLLLVAPVVSRPVAQVVVPRSEVPVVSRLLEPEAFLRQEPEVPVVSQPVVCGEPVPDAA